MHVASGPWLPSSDAYEGLRAATVFDSALSKHAARLPSPHSLRAFCVEGSVCLPRYLCFCTEKMPSAQMLFCQSEAPRDNAMNRTVLN